MSHIALFHLNCFWKLTWPNLNEATSELEELLIVQYRTKSWDRVNKSSPFVEVNKSTSLLMSFLKKRLEPERFGEIIALFSQSKRLRQEPNTLPGVVRRQSKKVLAACGFNSVIRFTLMQTCWVYAAFCSVILYVKVTTWVNCAEFEAWLCK